MIARLLTALGLAALFAFAVVRVSRPPSPAPASTPPTSFSAERAMRHVRSIAERPHPMGSADHDRVRDYVIGELTSLGLTPQVQRTTAIGTRYQEAGRVQNILARLPGREAGGQAVLLMAHYDGVEAGPAAGDDAAGSAAILESLRALRSGPLLTHDVIALFTDGEEAGLLGAAAFVREHPWIKDVGGALNFEARGTSGRSFMFETGPRNLDAARVLRAAPSVTAGSDFTTIYRTLPNDTDLSELAVAGVPALNFAFADGVDRYHTTHDDVAHLNPGSLQHHGVQMLALARAFGDGPLPRPTTGDGVFFTLPGVGLVVYPESWAMAFAALAAVLVRLCVVRVIRDEPRAWIGLTLGASALVVSIVVSGALAYVIGRALERVHALLPWGGAPAWSGAHWTGVALVAFAVVTTAYTFLRRRATAHQLHAGALIAVAVISLAVAARAPGMSYLFTWPVIAASLPALFFRKSRVRAVLVWVAAFFVTSLLVPISYAIGVVMLGVTGVGGIVSIVLVTLVGWLLAPLVETLVFGERWSTPIAFSLAAVALFAIGLLTVRSSDTHPEPSRLAYVMDAAPLPTVGVPGGPTAWLTMPAAMARTNGWARDIMSGSTRPPEWVARAVGRVVGKSVSPLPLEGPAATILADSTAGGRRVLRLRVVAPPRTTAINMRITGAPVYSTSIDGRVMDTTRFRRRSPEWVLQYWAPSDSGAVIELTLPAGARPALELTARSDGLPPLPGITIPQRPQSVVPVQTGDVTMTYRRVPLG